MLLVKQAILYSNHTYHLLVMLQQLCHELLIGHQEAVNANIVRPLMKRDTSHQNENPVTKKETKLRRSGAENESEVNQLRQLRSDNLTLNSTLDESMNKLTPFIADINLGDRSRGNQTAKPDTRLPKPVPINMHSRTPTLDFIRDAFLLDEEGDHLSDAPDASLLLGEDE